MSSIVYIIFEMLQYHVIKLRTKAKGPVPKLVCIILIFLYFIILPSSAFHLMMCEHNADYISILYVLSEVVHLFLEADNYHDSCFAILSTA